MRKLLIVLAVFIGMLVYNFYAEGAGFWRDYYFNYVPISISLLIACLIKDMKKVTSKGIVLFISLFFFTSAVTDNYVWFYFASIIITLAVIIYRLIAYSLVGKSLKSDKYDENHNYIVVRKPKRMLEILRAYFFLDSIGSVKIVNKGIEQGFKVKKQGTKAIQKKHTYNPNYFVYLQTERSIKMMNSEYDILFNNCTNCWNVNVLKEIKNGR